MRVTPIRSFTLLALAATFCFGVAHCAADVPALPAESSETIGPVGGTVATSNGTGIYVPPGALTLSETITVTDVASAPLLTQGTAVGQAILCAPEGAMFADPVTITLSVKPSLLPFGKTVDDIVIYTAALGSPDYTSLVTTVAPDKVHVVAQTTHFSYFVPIIPFPESAHPDSGVDATMDNDTGTVETDSGQPPPDTGTPPPPQDSGTADSSTQDTGSTPTDSGTEPPDTGTDASDSGADTGSVLDTGTASDTGTSDTGSSDTGASATGAADTGSDAGVQDSGSAGDTGSAGEGGGSETGTGVGDGGEDAD